MFQQEKPVLDHEQAFRQVLFSRPARPCDGLSPWIFDRATWAAPLVPTAMIDIWFAIRGSQAGGIVIDRNPAFFPCGLNRPGEEAINPVNIGGPQHDTANLAWMDHT